MWHIVSCTHVPHASHHVPSVSMRVTISYHDVCTTLVIELVSSVPCREGGQQQLGLPPSNQSTIIISPNYHQVRKHRSWLAIQGRTLSSSDNVRLLGLISPKILAQRDRQDMNIEPKIQVVSFSISPKTRWSHRFF